MSVQATDARRRWLVIAAIGVAFVTVAMLVAALVVADKPHFGWLVGTWFLPIITSGVIAGSVMLLAAAWKLPERRGWRGMALLAWGLVALTSPAFGILFLLPWGVLALTLPLIGAILVSFFRQR